VRLELTMMAFAEPRLNPSWLHAPNNVLEWMTRFELATSGVAYLRSCRAELHPLNAFTLKSATVAGFVLPLRDAEGGSRTHSVVRDASF
jgi:hypothetical protein